MRERKRVKSFSCSVGRNEYVSEWCERGGGLG